jgi:hypothetical protein
MLSGSGTILAPAADLQGPRRLEPPLLVTQDPFDIAPFQGFTSAHLSL